MYFIRCLWLETLQTPTVWLQLSLLPPFLKRTSPVSPVWTTTGLDLRCVYFLPPFAFQFSIQLLAPSLRALSPSYRWRCVVVFLPPMLRMWSSGATTPPPSTQMCITVWLICLGVSSPASMLSRTKPGLKEISLLWVRHFPAVILEFGYI